MTNSPVSTWANAAGQLVITLGLMFTFGWEIAHGQPVDSVTVGLLGALVGFYFYNHASNQATQTAATLLNAQQNVTPDATPTDVNPVTPSKS